MEELTSTSVNCDESKNGCCVVDITVAHLTASPFLGGPERQMLGLALSLPKKYRSVFLSFPERGMCRPFLDEARRYGFEAVEMEQNAPNYYAVIRELSDHLHQFHADVLCCHGYKPDLLGLMAARRVGIPVVSISRGWTGATLKVRFNEVLDRLCLCAMDRVVCVSKKQAEKVRRVGVPSDRVVVIRNAIDTGRFNCSDPTYQDRLRDLFPNPPARVVGAAGRLSPEKGFGVLVEAAGRIVRDNPDVGFVLFGDGPLREDLEQLIVAKGLTGRFILPGFRDDLDQFLPHLDLFAQSSFTEGLPNVVLEAFATGVPVVATAVGGTPEVVREGINGYLVPVGDASALTWRIQELLLDDERCRSMGRNGQEQVERDFSFEAQVRQYQSMFWELTNHGTTQA